MELPVPTKLQSQPLQRQHRRSIQVQETEESIKKPKKVNSEARKQQNRVASRNYREKRKRKLQYLQQLIKDGPDEQHGSEPSSEQYDTYERSVSADHDEVESNPSFMVPSNHNMGVMSANGTRFSEATSPMRTTVLEGSMFTTTQAYPFQSTWETPIYSPPPPTNMTWSMPMWTPGLEYPFHTESSDRSYSFVPTAMPQMLNQGHLLPQQPPGLLSGADFYSLGSASYRSQNQRPSSPSYAFDLHAFTCERTAYT
ncbi:hypothetical protein ACN47E_003829 [Coniothyrium glycines]